MDNLNTKKKDPYEFIESVADADLKQTIDHITDILLITYICGQFGFYSEISGEKLNIYTTYAKQLASRLGFLLPDKHNDKTFIWARSNKDNFLWMYKVWVALNKRYFDLKKEPHSGFKFSAYFLSESIFP